MGNEGKRRAYGSDLTDAQWKVIKGEYTGMRLRKWDKRELTDAVLYIVRTGCQWRNLPHDFPPWKTVSSFYCRAVKSGLWERIVDCLREKKREAAGKKPGPTYVLVDSQSAKTVSASEGRGYDGGKKNQGAQEADSR